MECTHEVQYNGLCALCGAILGSNENAKANINMFHNITGLTVSRKEAERLEKENAARLLKSRKLSLILDLDQTVVHATWDPTVGEWMNDENNANHPATKDIRKFTLPGSSLVYYIKLRPGLSEFLREISQLYELHIYTMGTRHYAEAVAREIDPEDKLFRGRILSRDESGSVTQKKIQRLFPCDTSMVVVLDDRSDVWSFSPNLVKIKPYEFFVGIGDINSPFAPKTPEPSVLIPPPPHEQEKTQARTAGVVNAAEEKDEGKGTSETDSLTVAEEQEDDEEYDEKILAQQAQLQEAMAQEQQQQRPLARKQSELGSAQDRPLLVDDDTELYTMTEILKEVHKRFYEGLDAYNEKAKDGAGSPSEDVAKPDVTVLIPQLKKKVLEGVHIVFSGLIPQQQALESSIYWQVAETFGAICSPDLTGNVTHVVAAKDGTDKVIRARRISRINIVRPEWLLDSAARWKRQDEKLYALPPLASSGDGGENEYGNPESTPLDFDDGSFEPDEHGLVENVDWDEADREVDDALNESGTDFDLESEAAEREDEASQSQSGGSDTDDFERELNDMINSEFDNSSSESEEDIGYGEEPSEEDEEEESSSRKRKRSSDEEDISDSENVR